MNQPDLRTRAGRKAWRHDRRRVAVRPRRAGLLLLAVGIGLVLLPLVGVHDLAGWSPRFLGLLALVAALPCLILAHRLRDRDARQRKGAKPRLPG